MSYYESIPEADSLLESLRSVGYTEETAIADIVDNAISADANEIVVNFNWDRRYISICDNGQGMAKEEFSIFINKNSL